MALYSQAMKIGMRSHPLAQAKPRAPPSAVVAGPVRSARRRCGGNDHRRHGSKSCPLSVTASISGGADASSAPDNEPSRPASYGLDFPSHVRVVPPSGAAHMNRPWTNAGDRGVMRPGGILACAQPTRRSSGPATRCSTGRAVHQSPNATGEANAGATCRLGTGAGQRRGEQIDRTRADPDGRSVGQRVADASSGRRSPTGGATSFQGTSWPPRRAWRTGSPPDGLLRGNASRFLLRRSYLKQGVTSTRHALALGLDGQRGPSSRWQPGARVNLF